MSGMTTGGDRVPPRKPSTRRRAGSYRQATGYRNGWRLHGRRSAERPTVIPGCMHSVVGLRPRAVRRLEPAGWFGRKTREVHETAYYWTIDGTDLTTWIRQRIQHLDPVAPIEETIWLAGDTEDALDRLDRLWGHLPPDLDGGRIALLSCPICGDLGCGAFTAELQLTDETVTWHQLGWNAGTADGSPFLYDPSLSVTFDRRAYVQTMQAAKRLLDDEATTLQADPETT